jgi:hypothetical protein
MLARDKLDNEATARSLATKPRHSHGAVGKREFSYYGKSKWRIAR